MASTYSDLKIELIGTGEQTGSWGNTTNTNLGTAIEEAIVGSATVSFSSADVTLTLTNTNGTQSARHLRLNLTGTSGGARNLILGSGCQIDKPYIINNGLADTVTVKNTTGTGVAVPSGKTMWVYNNGTNVVDVTTHMTSLTLGSALPAGSGGTGLTSPGASGNVLTSNGTAWASTAPSPSTRFSGGTTGFTPNTLSSGDVTLAGTLNIANGGTGASDAATARTNLGVPSTTGSGASGTWSISISGNAATAATATTANNALGEGQTWQNVTSSRANNTTYTNSTGKTIVAMVMSMQNRWSRIGAVVGSLDFGYGHYAGDFGGISTITVIVPPGSTYRFYWNNERGDTVGSPRWYELR